MKIVTLNTTPSLSDALETLDAVRNELVTGKLVAFFLAGVGDDDSCYAFIGSIKPVSRLRTIGAMATALHMFHTGEV